MNPSEFRPQSAVQISALVVVNIMWWMVMIAAIGLGIRYLGQCTVQPNIPIYLIVLGAASILSLCLTYTSATFDDGCICILNSSCMSLLHLFSFGWFIAGTIWVYPIYPPNYTPGETPYCHKTAYQFAFVVTTLVWVIVVLMFTCGCCFAVLTCCCKAVMTRSSFIPNRNTFYGATDFQEPPAGDV